MSTHAPALPDVPAVQRRRPGVVRLSTRSLLDVYQTLALGLAMGVIYLNLPVYGYVLNTALLPKYLFFAMFFVMAPVLVVRYRLLGAYLRSPFVLWAVLFLILNLVHLAGFSATLDLGQFEAVDQRFEARSALITTRIQYIVFAIILGFVTYTSTTITWLRVVVLLMVLVPAAVILDFAQPGLLYPLDTDGAVLGRAAAMFINPTMAGEALLLIFLIGCPLLGGKYRVLLFLLCGAAVMATFSRSSIIAWVLLCPILILGNILPRSAIGAIVLALGAAFLLADRFETYVEGRQELEVGSNNILARINFFQNYQLDDDSSEERAGVIAAGWDLFLRDPVFGAGAGATRFWAHRGSTHNQPLLLAAEYGVAGVGLWIWLAFILWKGRFFEERGLQVAVAFLFVFMSMFTHHMFDSASYWLATFALVAGNNQAAGDGDRVRHGRTGRRR